MATVEAGPYENSPPCRLSAAWRRVKAFEDSLSLGGPEGPPNFMSVEGEEPPQAAPTGQDGRLSRG